MELIVKIGADQQGLAQTLDRIKTQFQNMNTSAPASWSPQFAAMNQYGNIMQSADATRGFAAFKQSLSEISPGLGGLAEKLSHVAGPVGLLTAALGGLALAAHAALEKINQSAMLSRQSRITGASAGMLKNIEHAANLAGIEPDAAFMAINRLNAQVGAFNAGDDSAQKLFGELGINPSGQTVDALLTQVKGKFAGMDDPAKRARLSKGLFGRGGFEMTELFSKLHAENAGLNSDDIEQLAAVKKGVKGWWAGKMKTLDEAFTTVLAVATRAYGLGKNARTGEFSQTAGLEESVEKAAKDVAEKPYDFFRHPSLRVIDNRAKKTAGAEAEKTNAFDPDQLARAGLFAGSALLFNPAMNVEQQQLEVLRRIEANTDKNSIFAP